MDQSPATKLSNTELSTRVRHALAGIGITTIGQLSVVSLKRIATAGNMGHKGVQELYEFCLKHALKPESRTQAEITGLQPDIDLNPQEIKALIATQPHDQIRISTALALSLPFCLRMHRYHINTLADLTSRTRDVLVIEVLQSRASLIMELDAFLAATGLALKPITEREAWRLYAGNHGPRPPVDPERPLDEWVAVLGEDRDLIDDLRGLKYKNFAEILNDYPKGFADRHHLSHTKLTQLGKRLLFLGFDIQIPPSETTKYE